MHGPLLITQMIGYLHCLHCLHPHTTQLSFIVHIQCMSLPECMTLYIHKDDTLSVFSVHVNNVGIVQPHSQPCSWTKSGNKTRYCGAEVIINTNAYLV